MGFLFLAFFPSKAIARNVFLALSAAGQARYAQTLRNSGADEVIIPEYEGGHMTGRMIAKYYPVPTNLQ